MLFYRITLSKELKVSELEAIQANLNRHLVKFGVGIQDVNIVEQEFSKMEAENEHVVDILAPKEEGSFNYLSGRLIIQDEEDEQDYYLKLVKKQIAEFVEKELELTIEKFEIQKSVEMTEDKWVEIVT